jgi:hypothetical protein
MGWGNRKWQNDEGIIDTVRECAQGVSDDDVGDALLAVILAEQARRQWGGDE